MQGLGFLLEHHEIPQELVTKLELILPRLGLFLQLLHVGVQVKVTHLMNEVNAT